MCTCICVWPKASDWRFVVNKLWIKKNYSHGTRYTPSKSNLKFEFKKSIKLGAKWSPLKLLQRGAKKLPFTPPQGFQ